jgi:hypothetical protein
MTNDFLNHLNGQMTRSFPNTEMVGRLSKKGGHLKLTGSSVSVRSFSQPNASPAVTHPHTTVGFIMFLAFNKYGILQSMPDLVFKEIFKVIVFLGQ